VVELIQHRRRLADRAPGAGAQRSRRGRNLQHFCREANSAHAQSADCGERAGGFGLIAATPDQRPALAKAADLFSEEDSAFLPDLLQTMMICGEADPRGISKWMICG